MTDTKKMGKTPHGMPKLNQQAIRAAEEAIFTPSVEQKKIKHLFLEQWDGLAEPTCEMVASITGSPKVRKWWSNEQFRGWLTNQESTLGRLNYLVELALDTAEEILIDPECAPAARVNMIKTLLAYRHAVDSKQQTQNPYLAMPREQLVKLIEQKSKEFSIDETVIEGEEDDE
jgi:hypothetical protein